MLREVVKHQQHIFALVHEVLSDAGGRIRRDVRQTRSVIALGDDDDGVVEGPFFLERGHGARHRGSALADRAVHADHAGAALVQDRIDGDRALARLSIAEDELTLTTADRHERVDDLDAGLQRHLHGGAVHDRRRRAFDRQALSTDRDVAAVEGLPQRIDHATKQRFADADVHHAARA